MEASKVVSAPLQQLKEEKVLFPLAEKLLSIEEKEELERLLKAQ